MALLKSRFPFLLVLGLLAAAGLYALTALARPPDASSRLDAVIQTGLSADPTRYNSTALGATIIPAIATDIASAYRTDQFTQQFVVTNLESAGYICVHSTSWSGADTCATRCTAQAGNCTLGDAAMGSVVPFTQSRTFRYDGTRCVCIVGSTTNMDVQVERVVR